jgi:flagellar basal-body rod protein FlgG
MRALFTAATGMAAQQLKIDDIANNLANINTTAYKRSREDFQDLYYQRLRTTGVASTAGGTTPVGVEIGHGVRLAAIEKMFTQGTFTETKSETDLAIEGNGFFQLETPTGDTVYTRAGNFKRNSNGELVSVEGYKLKPGLAIPQDTLSISISQDGVVSVQQAGQSTPTQLGTIELTRFVNPGGLEPLGRNMYRATETSGPPLDATPGQEGMGTLTQGFLESSNVDIAEEMVQMIVSQRAYETSSKAMTTADQIMQYTNNLIR